MTYQSEQTVESKAAPGVTFTVARMSFARRMELMREIRDLAGRMEFLEAGQNPRDQIEAALLRTEIDRVYVGWGLLGVSGLEIDGHPATPDLLTAAGPEDLWREALDAVKSVTGLSEAER